MEYKEFLKQVIDSGIEGAKQSYAKNQRKDMLEGSIAGFEACRGKGPDELRVIFNEVESYQRQAMIDRSDNYWFFRCYQAEVEWVCNLVSALLHVNNIEPILPYLPTCMAMLRANEILTSKK